MDDLEQDGGEGEGQGAPQFVEVDGKKFVADENGDAKKGEDGNPIAFTEQKKFVETPEARAARLKKQTEQHREKYPHLYEDEGKGKKKGDKKSDELDYGQKAFLIAKGIEEAEDIALVQKVMSETGKSLEEAIASKYLQSELKERKEQRAVANALPGKGNRAGQSASNTVEYWLSKGGLPDNTPENTQLRRDIVNARLKKEKSSNQFTSNPVVGNPN